MAMMAMTTRSSMSVKPVRGRRMSFSFCTRSDDGRRRQGKRRAVAHQQKNAEMNGKERRPRVGDHQRWRWIRQQRKVGRPTSKRRREEDDAQAKEKDAADGG